MYHPLASSPNVSADLETSSQTLCSTRLQVRDRATLYLEQLEGRAGGFDAITVDGLVSAKNLESSLLQYLEGPLDAPFDVVRAGCLGVKEMRHFCQMK